LLHKLEADAGFSIVCMDGTPNVVGIIKAAWKERAFPVAAPEAPTREQQAGAASDDELIIEAVRKNKVYGVMPNSASTVDIGRAVLAAERRRIAYTPVATVDAQADTTTASADKGEKA
jgi:hypothetical protein